MVDVDVIDARPCLRETLSSRVWRGFGSPTFIPYGGSRTACDVRTQKPSAEIGSSL